MSVGEYVTDTQALLRYSGLSAGRLSPPARRIFRRCEEGRDNIIVPTIVAWETGLLAEDGAITLRPSFAQWWDTLASIPNYNIQPLDLEVVKAAYGLTILTDPSDRLIVATALALDLPLITADSRITDSGLVRVVW
ncbi:MAG: type II toxin-antitoxin system VapC family toxin [candidate division NC10 bacterium]|nr:type II toxin-antitoxin system VapC family toxin [candidate division NC10 bacterium]